MIKTIQNIFNDKLALQLFLGSGFICSICLALSWKTGIIVFMTCINALLLSICVINSKSICKKLQNIISNYVIRAPENVQQDDKLNDIDLELDISVERFYNQLLNSFVNNWFSKLSHDESSFILSLKQNLAQATRRLVLRYTKSNYPLLITNKLLPICEIFHQVLMKEKMSIKDLPSAWINNKCPIHPAVTNRQSEIQYLRKLSEKIIPLLFPPNNVECQPLFNLVRELFANCVLLPTMDIIADPSILNLLVILATDPKKTNIENPPSGIKVKFLQNFVRSQVEINEGRSQNLDGIFFKDQQKLYSFMQHLKVRNQNGKDVEVLKFFLDVEHLNSELEKSNVNPSKLSTLQQQSEKLLNHYRHNLYDGLNPPEDLIQAHEQAKATLEHKWKNDFYRSAEYYELIYGDREIPNIPETGREDSLLTDINMPSQKFSAKLKNAIRTGAVDGIEATEIPIFDAMDTTLGHSSYYSSVTVKLRKERGQNLDNFIQTLLLSIDQETDVGEDIALTQTQCEKDHRRKEIGKLGNVELYKNLFSIVSSPNLNLPASNIRTPTQSALYFMTQIIKAPEIVIKTLYGIAQFLPDSDNLVCGVIRRIAHKIMSQQILAKLIHELEEKIFHSKSVQPTTEELEQRRDLAMSRLEAIKIGLSENLRYLQCPVLNKNLMYCLMDEIILEGFPELE